jgi:hypothetical protein
VAALRENDLANRRPPTPSLITTLGGTIAAVCSRCQSQRDYEFAMDGLSLRARFQTMHSTISVAVMLPTAASIACWKEWAAV